MLLINSNKLPSNCFTILAGNDDAVIMIQNGEDTKWAVDVHGTELLLPELNNTKDYQPVSNEWTLAKIHWNPDISKHLGSKYLLSMSVEFDCCIVVIDITTNQLQITNDAIIETHSVLYPKSTVVDFIDNGAPFQYIVSSFSKTGFEKKTVQVQAKLFTTPNFQPSKQNLNEFRYYFTRNEYVNMCTFDFIRKDSKQCPVMTGY